MCKAFPSSFKDGKEDAGMGQEGCRGKVKTLWCSGRVQDEEEARGKELSSDAGVSGSRICSQSSTPNALLQSSVLFLSVLCSLFPPDCHPLCQQCVANLWDTGSVCLKCQNSRHLLLGDHCLPDCPLGHYAHHGTCKSECSLHTPQAAARNCPDPWEKFHEMVPVW